MKNLSPSGVATLYRSERMRTQKKRRFIAGLYVGVLATLMLVTGLVDSYWPAIPLVLMYMVATFLLYSSVHGMTDAPTSSLDERQVSLRNAVYRNSYWAGTMIAFLGGLFVARVTDWDTAFELGLFVGVWGLITGIPTLLLAWTLPSDVADEEE